MNFKEIVSTHKFKTLKQITELFNNPKDLVKIYNNMGICYPEEHGADTFSTRIEKEANAQLLRYPDDLLKYKEGSCIEHALFMYYFCEASLIYSKIAICEIISQYENIYYRWGHATCFIKIDKDKTGLFLYNWYKKRWEIQVTDTGIDECIEKFKHVMKICAQKTMIEERSLMASMFKTVYNAYTVEFDRYDPLAKAYLAHYNKKDISRIDFYYRYIDKEFKRKYGKEFINSDIKPTNTVYINTSVDVLKNIWDGLLILLKSRIL